MPGTGYFLCVGVSTLRAGDAERAPGRSALREPQGERIDSGHAELGPSFVEGLVEARQDPLPCRVLLSLAFALIEQRLELGDGLQVARPAWRVGQLVEARWQTAAIP